MIAGDLRQNRIALHRHHPGETFNRDTGEYAVVEHRSCFCNDTRALIPAQSHPRERASGPWLLKCHRLQRASWGCLPTLTRQTIPFRSNWTRHEGLLSAYCKPGATIESFQATEMKFQPSPRSYYSFNISGKRPRGRLVLERRARDPFLRAACAMKNSSLFPLPSRNRKGTRSRIFGFQNDFSHWTIFKAYSDFLAPAEFSTSPSHVHLPSLTGPGETVTLRTALSREKWIIRKFGTEVKQPLPHLSAKYQVSPLLEKKTTRLYTRSPAPRAWGGLRQIHAKRKSWNGTMSR